MKLYINQQEALITRASFPAGESLIRIDPVNLAIGEIPSTAIVEFSFRNNGDLIDLMLLKDALHRLYPVPTMQTFLVMHYLPYARQDRVCNIGESLSVKVITDLINSLNFTRVYCMNIHSDVGVAQWDDLTGKRHVKRYNIETYGEEEALRLASEKRSKMIEALNVDGAGYTETHGT